MDVDTDAAKEAPTDGAASGSESDADEDKSAGAVTCLAQLLFSHHSRKALESL